MKIQNGQVINLISEFEYNLERLKYLQSKYPDLKIFRGQFSSKLVNTSYTNLDVRRGYWDLIVIPSIEETFSIGNKTETIKIYSNPTRILICGFRYSSVHRDYRITFTKLQKNIKTNKFKPELYSDIKMDILNFIRTHADKKIDMENLDKRLKDLLIFD